MVLTSTDELNGAPTGYTLSEAAHPWKVFRDAGHVVDFASPQGGTPPIDPNSETDEITEQYQQDATVQAGLANTAKLEFVEPAQYDAIYLVGGHGTMADGGSVVSAVCHGPAGLLDVELANGLRIVEGKKVSAFTDSEETEIGLAEAMPFLLSSELEAQGANLQQAENWAEQVSVDDLLVTGQNPASAAGVAKEVVKILTSLVREEKAAEQAAAETLRDEKDAEKESAEQDKEKPAAE